MTITLPPELEAQLLEAAQLQGKDLATLVVEILIQVLAKDSHSLSPQPAKFMRFAGIASQDTA
ncbi:MAG: hypothetical protein SW833_24330 [Cyanobacteriota bacterium]|nr:hypothetical protein [Cyanobacteriota bacterium]